MALRSTWLLSLELAVFLFKIRFFSGGKRKSKEEKISVTETTISRPSFEKSHSVSRPVLQTAGFLSGRDHWHLDKSYFPEFKVA